MKLGNSFILISVCDLFFFVTMSEPKKRKALSIQEKLDLQAQIVASKETTCCAGFQVRNCTINIGTLLLKTRKTLKRVMLNVVGSLVKGRT
jgi:hypothetical protein